MPALQRDRPSLELLVAGEDDGQRPVSCHGQHIDDLDEPLDEQGSRLAEAVAPYVVRNLQLTQLHVPQFPRSQDAQGGNGEQPEHRAESGDRRQREGHDQRRQRGWTATAQEPIDAAG